MLRTIVYTVLFSLSQPLLSHPVNLKVNYLKNPLGIDTEVYFSWELQSAKRGATQTAYRILVASSPELLDERSADLWDSEKVPSSATLQIPYEGSALLSATPYYWKAICWDQDGNRSEGTGHFETGLFHPGDWKGQWIGEGRPVPGKEEDFYKRIPAPHFRKTFRSEKNIARARLYISGLGYHEVYLNGEKVSDYRLEPGWTQYAKTVYYQVHDVTGHMETGENALGVILGNGWYNPLPMRIFGRLNFREILTSGNPKLCCQLMIEYEDGSSQMVVSDRSWNVGEGPVVRNNVYLGEWYDAREEIPGWSTRDFDDSDWKNAIREEAPGGKLTWQYIPPVRLARPVLKPVRILENEPGRYVFDLGQNFAGVIRFRVKAPSGTEVVFRYAELLHPDQTINVNSSVAGQIKRPGYGGPGAPEIAWQEDRYFCKGEDGETFEPRFTFHGFRYVEVTGLPYKPSLDHMEGLPLNSDIADVSEFSCSNGLFNRIQEITDWTMLSNVFSVQSDCPAREKLGYGGDIVTVGEAYMYNYDMSSFYQKTVRDFQRDAYPSGAMTECAPDIGINARGIEPGTGPVGWTLAHPFILYQLYKYYGNLRIVEEQYPALKKLVDFYDERTPEYLILDCIGDHNSVVERPRPVSAASAYYHHVQILAELAGVLGKQADEEKYTRLASNIKQAFIEELVDTENGRVYSGNQPSQVFALYYDLLPEEVRDKAFQQLEDRILLDRKGHLTTGIFSTKMMLNYLSDRGRDDLNFIMLNQKTFPGYGFMIDHGATTLWENWSIREHDSENHPMFGSVSEWFYKSVLGIQQSDQSLAFSKIIIKPSIVGDLTWAKGSYHSVRGKIGSYWWKFGDDLHLEVTIPANTEATVYLPLPDGIEPDIFEGNLQLVKKGEIVDEQSDHIRIDPIRSWEKSARARIGSGTYHFIVR